MPPPLPSDRPPSFLDRKPWGLANWLVIAMAVIFTLAFVPPGVRRAIESNVNKAEDWLPSGYPESTDLRWFADHFVSAKFVLVSWDGCTLAAEAELNRVVDELRELKDKEGNSVIGRVLTGPGQVASLTAAPSNLERGAAIRRLEGALIGPPRFDAEGAPLGDQARTTCFVAYLAPHVTDNNLRMRSVVERITEIVQEQVGVEAEQVHLGGPPVDNVTIDIEGEKTLLRLAGFSGVMGLALAFWCFRSLRLTWFVFSVAGISAGVSLALVFWYGVFEIFGLGFEKKHLGTVDAILMSMPAVVYVLGLSGAIHIVNYYRDERDARGVVGAAERGVRIGWGPCALAALTTAVGMGSLGASQIIPIKKFGVFTAAGVMATVAVLLTILPICLHLFPPKLPGDEDQDGKKRRKKTKGSPMPEWARWHAQFVTRRHGLVTLACLAAMAWFAMGLTRTDTKVSLLGLLDPETKLIKDYGWFEQHLGNLVPMEVVLTLGEEHLREPTDRSDEGPHYRMTMYERMKLVERVQQRVESLDEVSRAMSAATFGPAERPANSAGQRRVINFDVSTALAEHRNELSEYLATEKRVAGPVDPPKDVDPTGRELWRISARVEAHSDIDYGEFVGELQRQVEPVLEAYRLRDELMVRLQAEDKQLVGSRVAVIFDAAEGLTSPPAGSEDALLVDLLRESGVPWVYRGRRGQVEPINAAKLRGAGEKSEAYGRNLARFDAVVTVSETGAAAIERLGAEGINLVALDKANKTDVGETQGAEPLRAAVDPEASLAAVYTGIVPLVYKTQRELLISLQTSIGWATLLIAGVMVLVLRSPAGGLVSMIPNVFPIVAVFGSLAWLGVKIDIGIMMTASVALGVAVDDTIHFLTWFRRGIVQGLDRRSATLLAFDRCAVAMTQTTLIAGLGLAVFATSTFTPTQQFGYLMITMLGAALVGDLVMLPAILCGPLGRFFAPGAAATPEELEIPATIPMPSPAEREAALAPPALSASTPSPPEPAPSEGELAESVDPGGPTEEPPEEEDPESAEPLGATEGLSPANAALHAKLKKFRRASPPDATGS